MPRNPKAQKAPTKRKRIDGPSKKGAAAKKFSAKSQAKAKASAKAQPKVQNQAKSGGSEAGIDIGPMQGDGGGKVGAKLVGDKKRKEVKKIVYHPFMEDYKYENPIPNGVELCCRRGDDLLHMCRILESKEKDKDSELADAKYREQIALTHVENKAMIKTETSTSSSSSSILDRVLPPHRYVYYVHYLMYNRRMDEWVTRDRLYFQEELQQLDTSLAGEEEKEEDSLSQGTGFKGTGSGALKRRPIIAPVGDHSGHDEHGEFDEESLKVHEEVTKVKNIESIVIGKYEMETWYFSPFPPEYTRFKQLLFCEFCLSFFGHVSELTRHMARCKLRHPPGNEIYRSDEQNVRVAFFEVDGRKERIYCQNLCYISKLFLDHKTLHYDTDPFLFYILTEVDDRGCHLVGYFSKEKFSEEGNNVACILTLPCHQRKGYGRFLISLSYELSKIEQKAGSPEKPLSDLGAVSYRSYWSSVLLDILRNRQEEISVQELSKMTSITCNDIIDTLRHLGVIRYVQGEYVFRIPPHLMVKKEKKIDPSAIYVHDCDPSKLHWTPYIVNNKRARTQYVQT